MPVLQKGNDPYQDSYRATMDVLLSEQDRFFNIDSYRYFDKETGQDIWVRDATGAYSLNHTLRPKHDAVPIEGNNALMRCLSRLRAIDYVIAQVESEALDKVHEGTTKREQIRISLHQAFKALEVDIKGYDEPTVDAHDEQQLAAIRNQERAFNTLLIRKLHEANLTEGCLTKQDAEKLLMHYRTLSSVLDPAMPLVTLTYDEAGQMLQQEVQYPVTVKTATQKEAIASLKQVVRIPEQAEKNSHTLSRIAIQQADACFADCLMADDRMLSAQARKTHLMTVKNAFIVKTSTALGIKSLRNNPLYSDVKQKPLEPIDDDNQIMLARTGSLVFVGKGEKKRETDKATQENLKQIQIAANRINNKSDETASIHLMVLNTDSRQERQDKILSGLRRVIVGDAESSHVMSNVPTNDIGTAFYSPSLSVAIQDTYKQQKSQNNSWWTLGQKATRLQMAVTATLSAIAAGFISCVMCASGQDRTGTVIEKSIQEKTLEQWIAYQTKQTGSAPEASAVERQRKLIQEMRARGFNASIISTHMAPGSPGLKKQSKANNWFNAKRTFGPFADNEFYLDSADTNKQNFVGDVTFLQSPDEVARETFEIKRHRFELTLATFPDRPNALSQSVKDAAVALNAALVEFKIHEHHRNPGIFRYPEKIRHRLQESIFGKSGKKHAQDLAYMTQTVAYATDAIQALQAGELEKVDAAICHLGIMQKKIPGYERIRYKVAALAIVLLITLVTVAALAYPPLGVFILSGALLVSTLTGVLGAVAKLSAIGVLAYAAWGTAHLVRELWSHGKEKDMAKAVGHFKKMIEQEKESSEQQKITNIPEGTGPLPDHAR